MVRLYHWEVELIPGRLKGGELVDNCGTNFDELVEKLISLQSY